MTKSEIQCTNYIIDFFLKNLCIVIYIFMRVNKN